MTDHNREEREALIRAVQAVTWNASNYPPKIQPHVLGQDIVPLTMKIVDAVEAVFEQAHTPTDDEREAARAYADAEYPELLLAPENEDKADIAERAFLAGARFRCTAVQEPSAHDGDCEADWGSEGQESPCRCAERAQGEPTEAQVRKEVARREEYAEAHGYPAFQDEGSAFIDGAEWMRAALRAAYEEGKKR